MKKIWKGIAGRIASGYTIIVVVALAISFATFFVVRDLRSADTKLSESVIPLYTGLRDLKNLNSISFKLTSNWIYQPTASDKAALKQIFSTDYPAQLERISEISAGGDQDKQIRSLLDLFKSVITTEMDITSRLSVDSLYDNDEVVDEVISLLDNRLKPASEQFAKRVDEQLSAQLASVNSAATHKAELYSKLTAMVIGSSLLFVVVGIMASWLSVKSIVNPMQKLKALILKLSRGEIAEVKMETGAGEIAEMADALNKLTSGMMSSTRFAIAIGEGVYDSDFQPLSEDDRMGNALLQMRQNLKHAAEEDSRRNWSISGMAQLAEIIRSADKTELLYDRVTQFMVKYIGANQGGLFVVEDDNPEDTHLRMVGCYAYDRKKFLNKRVEIGEGLVSQCYQEGDMIYLKAVPRSYVHISSGLGESVPTNVLLVPLKVDSKVHGVTEIASFHILLPHEIAFMQRLAEGIGSFIRNTRDLARTSVLLAELQAQRQHMLSQEEEMRQNMEELAATQEEMLRKEQEYLRVIRSQQQQQRPAQQLSDVLMASAGHDPEAELAGRIDRDASLVVEDAIPSAAQKLEDQLSEIDQSKGEDANVREKREFVRVSKEG